MAFYRKLFPLLAPVIFLSVISKGKEQPFSSQSFLELQECQGVDNCATWTFHNNLGWGEWPSGECAVLEIIHIDRQHITVKRTDFKGPKRGLEAVYEGTPAENGDLGGTFQENDNGKHGSGHWYFAQVQAKSGKPRTANDGLQQIVECESRGCSVENPGRVSWIFDGRKEGTGIFGTGNQPLTISRLDSSTIVVSRIDTSGPWRGSAIYTGHISGDHITGTVEYHDPGKSTPRFGEWNGFIGTTAIVEGAPSGPGLSPGDVVKGLQIIDQLIKIRNDLNQ